MRTPGRIALEAPPVEGCQCRTLCKSRPLFCAGELTPILVLFEGAEAVRDLSF